MAAVHSRIVLEMLRKDSKPRIKRLRCSPGRWTPQKPICELLASLRNKHIHKDLKLKPTGLIWSVADIQTPDTPGNACGVSDFALAVLNSFGGRRKTCWQTYFTSETEFVSKITPFKFGLLYCHNHIFLLYTTSDKQQTCQFYKHKTKISKTSKIQKQLI